LTAARTCFLMLVAHFLFAGKLCYEPQRPKRTSTGPARALRIPQQQHSSKRQKSAEPEVAMLVDNIPCEQCQRPESNGDSMLVCDWCGSASAHLGCLGLSSVPIDVWLCKTCTEQGHRASAQEAADLDGRWVLGRVKGIAKPFWGQVSCTWCYYGLLVLRYSDGELYTGVKAAHLHGRETLVWHVGLDLQPKGCTVPPAVLGKFRREGWLA
jgi:hypothetical protein